MRICIKSLVASSSENTSLSAADYEKSNDDNHYQSLRNSRHQILYIAFKLVIIQKFKEKWYWECPIFSPTHLKADMISTKKPNSRNTFIMILLSTFSPEKSKSSRSSGSCVLILQSVNIPASSTNLGSKILQSIMYLIYKFINDGRTNYCLSC